MTAHQCDTTTHPRAEIVTEQVERYASIQGAEDGLAQLGCHVALSCLRHGVAEIEAYRIGVDEVDYGLTIAAAQRPTNPRHATEADGVPALERLVALAQGNSGQPARIRRVLLGLYNGQAWPLDLTNLRGLDEAIQRDILAVLSMDMRPLREVHRYIKDGDRIFQEFWRRESEATA